MIALLQAFGRTTPRNPWGYASTVLFNTMRGYYNPTRRAIPSYETYDTFSLDFMVEANEEGSTEIGDMIELLDPSDLEERSIVLDEMFIDEYLIALECSCGRRARWAVANLLDPGESMRNWILLDVEEKETRKERRIVPRHRNVREALGLSVPSWFALLRDIRDFTEGWLASKG